MSAFDWTVRASHFSAWSTFSKEKVLHAKKREALGVSCFTIPSVKHCLPEFSTEKRVLLTKNHVERTAQSNAPYRLYFYTECTYTANMRIRPKPQNLL